MDEVLARSGKGKKDKKDKRGKGTGKAALPVVEGVPFPLHVPEPHARALLHRTHCLLGAPGRAHGKAGDADTVGRREGELGANGLPLGKERVRKPERDGDAEQWVEGKKPGSLADLLAVVDGRPGKGKGPSSSRSEPGTTAVPHRDAIAMVVCATLRAVGVEARLCGAMFPIPVRGVKAKADSGSGSDDEAEQEDKKKGKGKAKKAPASPASPATPAAGDEKPPALLLFVDFLSPDGVHRSLDLSCYSPPLPGIKPPSSISLGPSASFFSTHLSLRGFGPQGDSPHCLAIAPATRLLSDATERYFHPPASYLPRITKLRAAGRNPDPGWLTSALDRAGWLAPVAAGARAEAELAVRAAGFPSRLEDFKKHPLYALERHLGVHEMVYPPGTPILGRAGPKSEPVYPRSAVHPVFTKEKWLRDEGREVRRGERPAKWAKARKVTIKGKREVEAEKEAWEREGRVPRKDREKAETEGKGKEKEGSARKGRGKPKTGPKKRKRVVLDSDEDSARSTGDEVAPASASGSEADAARESAGPASPDADAAIEISSDSDGGPPAPGMVPLFGRWQTEPYRAPAVVDGIVPKSKFGNVDLLHPNMLPKGAAHLPHKGIGKIAKQLGVDYGEAVVGFEFRGGRSFPSVQGIVVPAASAEIVLSAFMQHAVHSIDAAERAARERAKKNWKRVLAKVMLKVRLRREYAGELEEERLRKKEMKKEAKREAKRARRGEAADGADEREEAARRKAKDVSRADLEDEYGIGGSGRRRLRRPRAASGSEAEGAQRPPQTPSVRRPRPLVSSEDEAGSPGERGAGKRPRIEESEEEATRAGPRNLASDSESESSDSDVGGQGKEAALKRAGKGKERAASPRKAASEESLEEDPEGQLEEEEADTEDEWQGFGGGGFIVE
ncbi:hypothetical protein DFJ74DRAFT_691109 [Hyaloraphidium curvatum]|nr:hypothetical protein DFJ74DRAFT_691109 [Hyaloraphidium curvatum]